MFMTLPHFEFLDDSHTVVNLLFVGVLGCSVGCVLYTAFSEIVRYLRD